MGFRSRSYTDTECAELDKIHQQEICSVKVYGEDVIDLFRERYQRDPLMSEINKLISMMVDDTWTVEAAMRQAMEERIKGIMDSMDTAESSEREKGDEDDI